MLAKEVKDGESKDSTTENGRDYEKGKLEIDCGEKECDEGEI